MDYNDEKEKEIVYVFKGEKIFPVINFLVTGTIFKSKDVTGCIHFPLYNQYQVMKQIKEFCGYFHSNKKDINKYINKFINLPFEIQKFFCMSNIVGVSDVPEIGALENSKLS